MADLIMELYLSAGRLDAADAELIDLGDNQGECIHDIIDSVSNCSINLFHQILSL